VTRIDGHVTLQLLTLVNYKYSRTFKVFTHGLNLLFCVFPAKQHMQCEEYLELYRLLVSPPLADRWTPHLSALVEIPDSPFRDQEVLPRNDNYAMSKLPHRYRDRGKAVPGGRICKENRPITFKKQISEKPTDFGRLLKRTARADPETKMMVLKGGCVENPVVVYRSFNLMTSDR
jgi:hypothetical protein